MNARTWIFLWMLVLQVCCAPVGQSEEPAANPADPRRETARLDELSLQQLLDVPYETVYGASKREQKTWEAPASISIVGRDEIKTYGYRSLADVLSSVPGIYTLNDRNYTYLGIRGFNRPGDYNSRVLVLVDGHRVNDNLYDSALLAQEALVDIDTIERVEVIRGPSSSLYGSSAFFGVINVITRRGGDIHGVEASTEVGTYETYKGRVTVGHKFSSGLEFATTFSYYDSQGKSRLYYPEFDSPTTHNGFADHLDWEQAWHAQGTLSYGEFTFSAGANSRSKGLPTAAFEGLFDDPRTKSVDKAGYADLRWNHEFPEDLKLSLGMNYHAYQYTGTYPYDAAISPNPPDILLNKDYARGDWWSSDIQLTKQVSDKLVLTGGMEYRDNFKQDQKNFDETTPITYYVQDRSHSDILGLYGQADYAPRTNINISAGLRYDHYSTVGNAVNPRVGFMYQAPTRTTLKLLYGRAFRAPNAYELHYLAPGYVPNPNLKPETIDTWELEAEQPFLEHYRFSLSEFYYQVHGLVSSVDDGTVFQYKNTGNARALGTEFALTGQWEKGWMARVSYTYQSTEDSDSGTELVNSPRHLAKIHLRIPVWHDRVWLGTELFYVGSMRAVQSGRVDGYPLGNVTLTTSEWIKGVEFSASLYNVWDQKYSISGFPEHRQRLIPQDGRTFRLKLTYKF